MYINQIDDFIDNVINKFFIHLKKKSLIAKFTKDTNFIKYRNNIIDEIKNFVESINEKEINKLVNKNNYNIIINIIKKYCAFYMFFAISYHYKGDQS